jgi:hypothetical protein
MRKDFQFISFDESYNDCTDPTHVGSTEKVPSCYRQSKRPCRMIFCCEQLPPRRLWAVFLEHDQR